MTAMILHRSIRRRSSVRSSWSSLTSAISSYSSDDISGCCARPFWHGRSYEKGKGDKKFMEIRNKKKVGILSIAVLAGITIIGSSVAYFTSTDTKDNLFTVGSVRTILHEDRWDDLADTDHNGIRQKISYRIKRSQKIRRSRIPARTLPGSIWRSEYRS